MINILDSEEPILLCYISLLSRLVVRGNLYSNSYSNIDTICNPIFYIQDNIQHYMQQYAISRIACQ